MNYCDVIARHFFNVVEMRYEDGTVLSKCPVRKGIHQAINQKFGGSNFPANVPAGFYKLMLLFNCKKTSALSVSYYIEIVYKQI